MKSMKHKMMAGTVAAALLIGGFGGVLTHPAYADDEDTTMATPAPVDTSIPLAKRVNLEWNLIVQRASGILDMDTDDLNETLKDGKSLSEVAAAQGFSAGALTSQLAQQTLINVTEALQSNKITQEEADGLNKTVIEKIQKIVDEQGYQYHEKQPGQKGSHFQVNFKEKADGLAKILGLTKAEVKKELSNGKTLADIAAAQGITEDQLLSKLSDELKPTLQSFIHQTQK